jgi:hypothetical protein
MTISANRAANRVVLASNVTGAGTYPAAGPVEVPGGNYILVTDGTFGASALTLTRQGANEVATAVPGVSITALGVDTYLSIGAGTKMQAVFTGGAPANMFVELVLVPARA